MISTERNFQNLKIALLLVTFNRAELLEVILDSIKKYKWSYYRFVIIDNNSSDRTQDLLIKYKSILSIHVLSSPENIGHGAGLAQGLRYIQESGAKPDQIVFLEDDSIPGEGYLEYLLQASQNQKFTLISSAGYQVKLGKRIKIQPKENEIVEADFGLFDGAIARFEDLMKVGYPIENWFMMFDDFEYCYRIKKAGFKIGVLSNPHVEILHEGWGGGKSHSHLWRAYYQSRNFVLFIRGHFTFWNLLDCIILQFKRLLGGLMCEGGWKITKLRLMGIRAGILGRQGKSLNINTFKEL